MKPSWESHRTKPYTPTGIRRVSCIRCGDLAYAQWQVCADGNVYRPICWACDIALNRLALEFMGHPSVDAVMDRYSLGQVNP